MISLTRGLCRRSFRACDLRNFRTSCILWVAKTLKVFGCTEEAIVFHLAAIHACEDLTVWGPIFGMYMFENFLGWLGRMCHRQTDPEASIMVVHKAVQFCFLTNPTRSADCIAKRLLAEAHRIPILRATASLMTNPSGVISHPRVRGFADPSTCRGQVSVLMKKGDQRNFRDLFFPDLPRKEAAALLPEYFMTIRSMVIGGYRRAGVEDVTQTHRGKTYSAGFEMICVDSVVRFGNVVYFARLVLPDSNEVIHVARVDVFQTVGKSARSGEQIVNVQNFFFRGYIRAGELLRMVTFADVLRADRKSPHDRKVLYCSPEYL